MLSVIDSEEGNRTRFARGELTDRQQQERSRHAERQRVARVLAETGEVAQFRCQVGGDQAAGVDGEVEDAEEGCELRLLLRHLELVASER